MPSALITGVTGQDGSYLAERLTKDGWSVHGTRRHLEPVPVELQRLGSALTLHTLDLRVVEDVARLIQDVEPDHIYNLAGISSVGLSWSEPVLTAHVNGTAVVALLEAAWQLQQRTGRPVRVLQASSAEMFAGTRDVPQRETTALDPTSPYGAAKAFAHHAVRVYRRRGLHACSAVLYNHESHRRPVEFVTRKISAGVAAIAQGRQRTLALGSLGARRDWGWAPEYVDGMVRSLAHTAPTDFVLATGESHTVEDFVAAAFSHAGMDDWERFVVHDRDLTRPGDAVELVGDASRARELLGWVPQTTFSDLVRRMVEHDLALVPE